MKRKERNHTNKSPSLRGAQMLKLSMGWLTTRQSPCTIWDFDQRSREGALISFSGMETVLALFSQPGVSFGGSKERGVEKRHYNSITGNQAGLKTLAC